MMNSCHEIHQIFFQLPRLRFPFEKSNIPLNGIYILFEKGENGHGGERIVRVGTHTGDGQLPSRLRQHFIAENKDRSIFRKNIGRAFLNADNDLYLHVWNLDLTTRKAKETQGHLVMPDRQQQIEQQVSVYLQHNLSFVVFPVENKSDRLRLESRIISSVSLCQDCRPSANWLGLKSPKKKVRESGLWLVKELYKEPLSTVELQELQEMLGN
jgi:hypothetical protein